MRRMLLTIVTMLLISVCHADNNSHCEDDYCCNENNYCVGVGGRIFGYQDRIVVAGYSEDGGKTWIKGYIPYNDPYDAGVVNMSKLICSKDLKNCAITLQGNSPNMGDVALMIMTHDFGKNWNHNGKICCPFCGPYGPFNNLYKVVCDEGFNKCVSVGSCDPYEVDDKVYYTSHNLSLYTIDGGENWYESHIPQDHNNAYSLRDVNCNGDECIAKGEVKKNGNTFPTAYQSNNFGKDWVQSSDPAQ